MCYSSFVVEAPMTSPPTLPKAPAQAKEAEIEICEALLRAQQNFGPLVKDANNAYLKSSYISLAALLKAVTPALTEQGILVTHCYEQRGTALAVVTTLVHVSTQTRLTSCFPVLSMDGAQKVGACGTYGQRYNLILLLNIAAADDDGNTVSNPQQYVGPDPQGIERTAPQNVPQPTQPEAWL